MQITLRVFATLCRYIPGAIAGVPVDIDLPEDATVADLIEKMKIPAREVKIAFVNGRTQPPDWVLKQGDEVGIFPPVGGG
jgi:molybdopterin synthase sulfur carrier subunit